MSAGGTLRVHFTAGDVARTRLADSVDVMWEIALSLHLLQNRQMSLVFDGWRRSVLERARRGAFGGQLSFLTAIDPPAHYFPDFITPVTTGRDLASGIDAVRSTPVAELRSQLARLERTHALPASVAALASGDRAGVDFLCQALVRYHHLAVGPYLPHIGRRISQIRDLYYRRLAEGGTEALFGSLGRFRWRDSVLETDFPYELELRLEGRGLLLVPSFFCVRYPVKLFDPALPPVLVFPISHDPAWLVRAATGTRHGSLARLLGATRAGILELVGDRRALSTATIRDRLHLSPPAVSYHTKILRESGLLGSRRDGPSMIHHITPLGTALLRDAVSADPLPS